MAREEELIEQIKNGRRECLDELVAFYYPAILRYCLWHMPDRESVAETICVSEDGYQAAEDRQLLANALTYLDNEMRELILLRYGQELTFREIAEITGIPLRTLQTRVRRAVKKGIFDEAHLEETQRLARSNLTIIVNPYPLSLWKLMAKQLKFLAWRIWLLQGMVLTFLCGVFFSLYGGTATWWNEWSVAKFLCISGGIIAACALPILQRSVRYRMFELECSTRFSLRGGLAAQLLFIGIGDAGMLTVLAFLSLKCGADGQEVFLFGVIPFLTTAVTGLMLWARTGSCVSNCRALLICILSVLFAYEMVVTVKRLLPGGIIWFGIFYALLCIGMIGRGYRKLFLLEREGGLLWKSY